MSYIKLLTEPYKTNSKIIIEIALKANKNCILLDYFLKFCLARLMYKRGFHFFSGFIAISLAHNYRRVICIMLMPKKFMGNKRKLEQLSIITNSITFIGIPEV